ncbi:MAG: GNAT family N-acetyltransferase [Candidatus Taylorbacteria bacterium]|nr:GNAT family N-acetyltransferase [Candidatus Taylorbacteria bacterium]
MDIKTYRQPNASATELTEILREKYGSNKNFDYFLSDFKKAFNFCLDNENVFFYPIAGFENGKMSAHAALIIDRRLPDGEAFFGFLEFPQDKLIFNLLWGNLIEEAKKKGIKILKGPVNGSIWHQYRCIKETDNSPFFKTELFCESYYYDFLISSNPNVEVIYHSAYREPFDIVLHMISEDSYKKLTDHGFSIKETKHVTPEELRTIAEISRTVFHGSWGFTELNEKEFTQLYSPKELAVRLNTLFLLYRNNEIIGFCSTSNEDAHTLICKTICILPKYQGLGLGNALAYRIHFNAQKEGFNKMIYALIREGNNIKNFPKEDTVIFRRYAAFEFLISST